MKRLKNNKGITGIDIVVSITLIVITLGIVVAVYTSYSNKVKEVKRTTQATNLAMKVIEKIETMKISEVDDDINISETNSGKYGLETEPPAGYTIKIVKKASNDDILKDIAVEVDVTVTYKVQDEEKKVTLSTIKKYEDIGEAEKPNMDDTTIKDYISVKYDLSKKRICKNRF